MLFLFHGLGVFAYRKTCFYNRFLFLVILLVAIGRGVMQGVQDFKNLSVNYIIEGVASFWQCLQCI